MKHIPSMHKYKAVRIILPDRVPVSILLFPVLYCNYFLLLLKFESDNLILCTFVPSMLYQYFRRYSIGTVSGFNEVVPNNRWIKIDPQLKSVIICSVLIPSCKSTLLLLHRCVDDFEEFLLLPRTSILEFCRPANYGTGLSRLSMVSTCSVTYTFLCGDRWF